MAIVSGVLLALPFAWFLGDAYGERSRGPGNLSFRGGVLAVFLLGGLLVPLFRRAGPLRSLPVFLLAGLCIGWGMHALLGVTADPSGAGYPGRALPVALGSGAFALAGGWAYLRLFDRPEGE